MKNIQYQEASTINTSYFVTTLIFQEWTQNLFVVGYVQLLKLNSGMLRKHFDGILRNNKHGNVGNVVMVIM